MTSITWNYDVIMEFLDLYRSEQLLWDSKHPMHKNRSEINDAWLRIQEGLSKSFTIVDLKKKKESLMTAFRMHYKRKRQSPSGYQTTWFAFSFMESFLGDKYEHELMSTTPKDNEFSDSSYIQSTSNNISSNLNDLSRISYPESKSKLINSYRRKETNESPSYLDRDRDTSVEFKDEYELYGQLLAKKLRKLDEHLRDVAMHEIDDIMFRVKMQGGMPSGVGSSSSPNPRKLKSRGVFVLSSQNEQYEDEDVPYQDHMQGKMSDGLGE